MSPTLRLAVSLALVLGWLLLLFTGAVPALAAAVLLAAGVGVFPWRAALAPSPGPPHDGD